MKTQVKQGDHVRVKYTGLSMDAAVTPRRRRGGSVGKRILDFVVGSDEVIRGISLGVVGMVRGETKRLTLDPQDAFGEVRRELFKEIPLGRFPPNLKLAVGKRLAAVGVRTGRRRHVQVARINAETVVIDGNHPLAGKTVEVVIEVISLASANSAGGGAPQSE